MRRLWLLGILVSLLAGLAIFTGRAAALGIPPKPTASPVVDQTGTLTSDQQAELAATIAVERSRSGNQLAVLMIPTLSGDALEDYSIRVARGWGIGEKGQDNGVLLLIVKNDRKLRIEVGYGLEGSLTDARASRIIRDRITPEFKQGRYYEGIQSGLTGIISAIHNDDDAALSNDTADDNSDSQGVDWWVVLYALLIIPSWLASMLARSKSWWGGGIVGLLAGVIVGFIFGLVVVGVLASVILFILGLLFDKAVSKNYSQRKAAGLHPSWWAGGSSFGGGSGGFGGFGGGGFGGGGSSGGW
jgi:uncharacterized protein